MVLQFEVDLCGSSASLIVVSQFNLAHLSPSLVEHPSGRDAQPGCPGDALPLGRGVDPAKQIGVQALDGHCRPAVRTAYRQWMAARPQPSDPGDVMDLLKRRKSTSSKSSRMSRKGTVRGALFPSVGDDWPGSKRARPPFACVSEILLRLSGEHRDRAANLWSRQTDAGSFDAGCPYARTFATVFAACWKFRFD